MAQPGASPRPGPAMVVEWDKASGLQCLGKLARLPASVLDENIPTL